MLCRMAPADALTSAGAFVFMPWLVRKRDAMFVKGFCGGCDFGQLRRPMLKRLFAGLFLCVGCGGRQQRRQMPKRLFAG